MPVIVEIVDDRADQKIFDKIFSYFIYIDETFSTYKDTSEITKINQNKISESEYSEDMKLVLHLSEETKKSTGGYFDVHKPDGVLDPSGMVKGWAIYQASEILRAEGYENFYIDIGGDIQVSGKNAEGNPWTVGIRNPFTYKEQTISETQIDQGIVKVISVGKNEGIATSGIYIRGKHIYNPITKKEADPEIVSITVVGKNIYEADRFATAAFAMGKNGILFIESLPGLEGYAIDKEGIATETSGFSSYVHI